MVNFTAPQFAFTWIHSVNKFYEQKGRHPVSAFKTSTYTAELMIAVSIVITWLSPVRNLPA